MGRSTDCDVVKFGISNIANFDMFRGAPSIEHLFFIAPESYIECKYKESSDDEIDQAMEDIYVGKLPLREWAFAEEAAKIGKKGSLWANRFTKGEHEVFLINESEYSSGGAVRLTIVSNDKKSIKKFMKAFADVFPDAADRPIEKSIAVQQTL